MKSLLAALRFLTLLPVPGRAPDRPETLAASVWWFPVVGAVLGGLAAAVALLVVRAFPPWPAAALLLTFSAALTGGLHLDGLADSADGLLSWRPRERALEIMHDSRIGTMGVLALVFVLLLKFTLIGSLTDTARLPRLLPCLFLMPVAGRCAVLMAMSRLPYARPEGGLGALFWRRSWARPLWALAALSGAGWFSLGSAGLVVAGGVVVGTLLVSWWTYRRLGGGTGDTMGATSELLELVPALVCVAWPLP